MIPGVRLLTGFHTSRDLVFHPFVNNPWLQSYWLRFRFIWNDSYTWYDIFRYVDEPFSKEILPACQECWSWCLCKACSSLGWKRGNERAITGWKIILTYSLLVLIKKRVYAHLFINWLPGPYWKISSPKSHSTDRTKWGLLTSCQVLLWNKPIKSR